MRTVRAWWMRALGAVRAHRRAEQFDAELASHLELHVEDNRRRGMSEAEARRDALLAIGGIQAAREAYRDRSGIPAFDTLSQDIRFAFRMLRKAPAFTAAAILIVAIGVGANATVFSVINAALLRPAIPGMRHDHLVGVYAGDRNRPDAFRLFSYAEYTRLKARRDVFADLLAEGWLRAGLTEHGQTRPIEGMFVSSNYFAALNLPLTMGRGFTADEEHPLSGALVAVVSHAFWLQRGQPADIVGRQVMINGQRMTIVGVAAPDFHGTMPVMRNDLWLPLGARSLIAPEPGSRSERSPALLLSGILAGGLSTSQAETRLAPGASGLAAADLPQRADLRVVVQTRSRTGRSPAPRRDTGALAGSAVLMALSAMVLLVACLNLANMLLARGGSRRQEIAVRLTLGGSRYRIVRQLLIEGFMLSLPGGVAALLTAWWAAERFQATLANALSLPIVLDVSPDIRVVAVVVIASIGGTLIFSLGPAWQVSKPDLATTMKASLESSPGARRVRLPSVMVATQVALSLALLVAAGVFMRSGTRAATRDPGFPLAGGLMAQLDVAIIGLDGDRARTAYDAVLHRVRQLRGVRDASLASIVPFGNDSEGRMVRPDTGGSDRPPTFVTYTIIASRYFATLGLPVIAGREFTESEERATGAGVAIVDRSFADRLLEGANPLGRTIRVLDADGGPGQVVRIVGMVATVRDDVMEAPDRPHLYMPLAGVDRRQMTVHVAVAPGREAGMIEPLRQAIQDVDATLPIVSIRTLTDHRAASVSLIGTGVVARLFAVFGAMALVLATVGVYGLRAYLVMRRTREIGIRVALGATRLAIVGQLVREGLWIAGAGMVAGFALAIGVVQMLRQSGMLFDVGLVDPVTFLLAALIMAVATVAASYLPTRSALRIDPATALRPE